ncbi:MAG: hypothetical protein NC301_00390 [Bacteroides sp.]|nr:hypothetical protein [Bacteroides sp.]MCM1379366.1 hypothetical protein [Bacteroides sp.]MCM1445226.1 hypothetical protein [Prevotella sp.]
MKKSLLILSLLASAASMSAQDVVTPGTAAAPNYYIIKANRGDNLYLGYGSATGLLPTDLCRTAEPIEASIWAVWNGTADGSVVIKNYTTDAYLMNFIDIDGSTLKSNATAVTVSEAKDIYLQDMGNGAYAINIKPAADAAQGEAYALDAAGGASATCGNWYPNTDQGACWWFTKLDLSKGAEAAIADYKNGQQLAAMKEVVDQYVYWAEQYKQGVPQIADVFDTLIEKLNAFEYVEDYTTAIRALWDAAITEANDKLLTSLNEQTLAIKSPRRVITASNGAYLSVATDSYIETLTYAGDKSQFLFTQVGEGGYTIFNAATRTYICKTQKTETVDDKTKTYIVTTADAAEAQVFYPSLYAISDEANNAEYYGLSLATENGGAQGLNWQGWNGGLLSYYSVDDAGSVWQLVSIDGDAALADAIKSVEDALSPYLETLPIAKEIIDAAIADAKKLVFNEELGNNAAEIVTKATADINALLATGIDGKTYALKYLRGDNFLDFANGDFVHTEAGGNGSAGFTFKAVADGGYKIYNAAAQIYVGPKTTEKATNSEGQEYEKDNILVVTDEAEALTVYPCLKQSGALYGVAFCLNSDFTGAGLNMNAADGLHAYSAADAGSIWGIMAQDGLDGIEAPEVAAKAVVEGIFDLQGRRLSAPVKGINIINGKKVLVK